MKKVRISFIMAAAALVSALSMSSQAATLTYSGVVTESLGAFAGLLPVGTLASGDIVVTDASFMGGASLAGDITDIGVAVGGFCFTFGAGTCAGAVVPITSIDDAALTYPGGSEVNGFMSVTAFSPTFNVSIPIDFCFTCGTFDADGGFLGSVSGTGDATAPVVPIPAAAWLFGSALLGLVGIRRRAKA